MFDALRKYYGAIIRFCFCRGRCCCFSIRYSYGTPLMNGICCWVNMDGILLAAAQPYETASKGLLAWLRYCLCDGTSPRIGRDLNAVALRC